MRGKFKFEIISQNSLYFTQNISKERILKSSKVGLVNKLFVTQNKIPPWGYPNSLFNGAIQIGTNCFNPNQRIQKMGMSSWENIKNRHLDEKEAYGKESILIRDQKRDQKRHDLYASDVFDQSLCSQGDLLQQ